VLEQAVSDATRALLEERNLRPAMQPRVDLVSGAEADGKADLEFQIEMEVLPEIAQPDLSDLTLTRLKATADAETVDKALKDIASRQRNFATVEEICPAAVGDVVVVDFVGKLDGVPFEGVRRTTSMWRSAVPASSPVSPSSLKACRRVRRR
jgi:trigger factor